MGRFEREARGERRGRRTVRAATGTGGGDNAVAATAAATAAVRLNDWDLPRLLYALACRDDGWLRFIPSGDGKTLYLKWKFTSGRFAGHYAFVSGRPEQAAELLERLMRHVDECYDGSRRPTLDRYYNE